MDARSVLWLSLVWIGCLLSMFLPINALLGFSLGVFFAALAQPFIGYIGLGFYYLYYVPLNFSNWYAVNTTILNNWYNTITSASTYAIEKITVTSFWWKPQLTEATAIQKLLLMTSQFRIIIFVLTILLWSLDFVMPLIWFLICKRVIQKLHIQKRIGLVHGNTF